MAHLTENSYAIWSLTDEEFTVGSIFTITQTQVLQNHLGGFAEEMLGLEFDAANPGEFLQQQADLSGKIKFIQYLIDNSVAMQELNNPDHAPLPE